MNKTFLAIMGSVVIVWTLATPDAQAGYWTNYLLNCPPDLSRTCCYP